MHVLCVRTIERCTDLSQYMQEVFNLKYHRYIVTVF